MEKTKNIALGNVHVWILNLNVGEKTLSSYGNLLSSDEIKRVDSFRFTKDRTNFIVARGILRLLCANYLGCEAVDIVFKYGAYGKPELEEEAGLKFNLSHSGRMAVIGFTEKNEIGIDIEQIDPEFDHLEIGETVFSNDELHVLKELKDMDLASSFYTFWTRKEAFIKCTGYGLSMPIKLTEVTVLSDLVEILKKDSDLGQKWKQEWSLESFIPKKDYKAAIALNRKIESVSYANWPG